MTILETLLIICIIIFLTRIFIYNYNKKQILKTLEEDYNILTEVQHKSTKKYYLGNSWTTTFSNREGQLFQIKKIKNQLEKL